MAKVTGDGISLSDLEEIVGGNTDDAGLRYDPAEDGFTFIDKDTDEPILTVRQNGEVVIPIEANVESIDITQLTNDLDVDNFDLNNIGTIRANTSDVGTFIGDLLDLTDADIDKLVSNLSANGYDINAIGTASADTVSVSNISGGVTDGQGDVTRLPGAGLSVENGDLVVTASFSGISGISNPLTADLNADGFDIQNVNRANVEELTDDKPIDLVGTSFERAGHDEVDVPQVRELTVEDWESGTLNTDVWSGDTNSFDVQSSVVLKGDYSVQSSVPDGTSFESIFSPSGLSSYPDYGDVFEYDVYVTDIDDDLRFGVSVLGERGNLYSKESLVIQITAKSDELTIIEFPENSKTSTPIPISSNYLDEKLHATVNIGEDNTVSVTLDDSAGVELGTVSRDLSKRYGFNGIGIAHWNNTTGGSTAYWDNFTLKRRVGEYTSETQKGITELGNEVTPSGAIHTGPLESSTNALRQEYATAPVNSDATQGDTSLLTLLKSGVNPAMYMERTMDGQGGAYGHQLQTALGRFARINANLSWEYNTLADVPNWESGTNGGTYSFSVTDRPRHIRVEHDGSSTSNVEGQILGNPLITSQSLGAFRITFHNIQFTDNTDQRFRVGIADASESVDPESGNAIIYGNDVKDRFVVLDSGTPTDITSFTDWSDGRTVSIEYDGVEARAYVDGDNTIEGNTLALPYSVNTDFRPLVHLRDQGSDTVSDVVEVEQVTVEPLPEVLQ